MASIIYNYPKSSCVCANNYNHECKIPKEGIPTNLGIKNCEIPSCFDLVNEYVFKNKIEPTNETGWIAINPRNELQEIDDTFSSFNCPNPMGGCGEVYIGTDPRLRDAARGGQVLPLDRPPITYNIDFNTVNSDESLNNYGKNYKSYADINAGQINYFIDKSRQDAFYSPEFTTSARTIGYMYKDPMGGLKPHYERQPLTCSNPLEIRGAKFKGGLSWIQDTEEHRQDLLSKQLWKQNQERWDPRWT